MLTHHACRWTFLEDRSSAREKAAIKSLANGQTTFGYCDVSCELVLAFRTLATLGVFLYQREHRTEIWAVGTLCRRLWRRVSGCTGGSRSGRVRFRGGERLVEVQMVPYFGTLGPRCVPSDVGCTACLTCHALASALAVDAHDEDDSAAPTAEDEDGGEPGSTVPYAAFADAALDHGS